ncbi:hypothetical protein NP233_g11026 [Leucocoprinus birnbaumii]|uniref:F-box domain-containing protein n=1 Tax=Leucocoprinus birnbaumii TaxID=56174 RepID=A0AAD5VJM8_9AGAR|nr:hypothetical protein NP233_g11026 [Leucocoprinus birnbaumii]
MTLPHAISKSLLRASYPPTNKRVSALRVLLAEALAREQVLEADILRLCDLSRKLSRERQGLAVVIEQYQNLVSPMNRLPDDILQEIFNHSLPMAHNAIMSVQQAPLLLGRVCSRWRVVAYSTPQLWTSIRIVASHSGPFKNPEERSRVRLEAVTSWLSRSCTLPLSISLVDNNRTVLYEGASHPTQPYPLELDVILPHLHRWKSFYLQVQSVGWMAKFLRHIEFDNAPCLQHIAIDYALTFWRDECSSLKSLAIVFLSADPWSYWPQPLQGIFSPPRDSPVILHNVQTLALTVRPGRAPVYQIFEGLSVPSLKRLVYHHRDKPGKFYNPQANYPVHGAFNQERVLRSLLSTLDKLASPLEELDLWLDYFEEQNLLRILRDIPGLRRLSLGGFVVQDTCPRVMPLGDSLLERFIPANKEYRLPLERNNDEEYHLLCPNLETVSFLSVTFSNHTMLKFLRSRTLLIDQVPVSRLRKVMRTFDNESSLDNAGLIDVKSQIRLLGEETGIRVDLHYKLKVTSTEHLKPPLRALLSCTMTRHLTLRPLACHSTQFIDSQRDILFWLLYI